MRLFSHDVPLMLSIRQKSVFTQSISSQCRIPTLKINDNTIYRYLQIFRCKPAKILSLNKIPRKNSIDIHKRKMIHFLVKVDIIFIEIIF